MRTLYHFPLSPFSRKVRLCLKEKGLDFDLVLENYWERRPELLAMDPAAQVPVLKDASGDVVVDSTAIVEYLEERYPEPSLYAISPTDTRDPIMARAEVRRLANWFNNKFYYEVTKYILDEKVLKFYRNKGEPNSEYIRVAKRNILTHLDYIAFLTREHTWLAGDRFSLADITAASHLSVLDYLGDVPWEHNIRAKEWYAIVKSRPSFRPLLADRIPGFTPPLHYMDLDF